MNQELFASLKNRRVLVTGASSGIGAGIARAFGACGARLLIHYRSSATGAQATADAVTALGGEATIVQADLRAEAAIDQLFAEVDRLWGGIDVLVNNAGIVPKGSALATTAASWDDTLNINLRAPYLLSRHAARRMIDAGQGGNIINITSVAGTRSAEMMSAYAASKAALDALHAHPRPGMGAGQHPRQRGGAGRRAGRTAAGSPAGGRRHVDAVHPARVALARLKMWPRWLSFCAATPRHGSPGRPTSVMGARWRGPIRRGGPRRIFSEPPIPQRRSPPPGVTWGIDAAIPGLHRRCSPRTSPGDESPGCTLRPINGALGKRDRGLSQGLSTTSPALVTGIASIGQMTCATTWNFSAAHAPRGLRRRGGDA